MRLTARLLAASALLVLFGGGCAIGGQSFCPEGMGEFIELNVYFGQEKGDGSTVSEDEWQAFLADTVTPRFPDGLTVLDANGQWHDTSDNRLYRESTKLLNALVPSNSADAGVASVLAISDDYKQRFDQQAVFYTSLPACAALR